MASSLFYKINDFVHHLCQAGHDLDGTHQLELALSNTAPGSESSPPNADGNGVRANVTEIAYTYLNSPFNLTVASLALSSGTVTLKLNDFTITATGGTAAGFRYLYVWNDGTTVFTDPLICYFDYGSTIALGDGESLTVDWNSDALGNGTLFTLT